MASSNIAAVNQTVLADGVTSVVVTDIVPVSDQFVREVRVFGPDGNSVAPIFVLRLSADTDAKVKLTTPTLTF